MTSSSIKISGVLLTGILLVSAGIIILEYQPVEINNWQTEEYSMNTFSSYEEFTKYLQESFTQGTNTNGFFLDSPMMREGDMVASVEDGSSTKGGETVDYSETNIQVEGVDEPDLVKTDGTNLYMVSKNTVFIINAYPPQSAEILQTISFNDSLTIQNLFIKNDRLVVFGSSYNEPVILYGKAEATVVEDYSRWYNSPDTYVFVYDISNLENPEEVREIIIPGSFNAARMINDHVYVITTQYSYETFIDESDEIIPKLLVNGETQSISLDDIHYVDIPEKSSTMTNVISFSVTDDEQDITSKSFLLGNTQTVYVSQKNIYIAYADYNYDYDSLEAIIDEVLKPYLSDTLYEELEVVDQLTLENYQKESVISWLFQNYAQTIPEQHQTTIAQEVMQRLERTILHRIHIEDGAIEYMAQGIIPGYVQNQFSFSEFEGHLRVSSTMQGWMLRSYIGTIESQNNVYVLNMNLELVGSVTGLAEGETIYATRFMGDRCYLVTFKQIDPFFVIDLSDPENPLVLGQLKIPGYSTYLHSFDDNHVIGIGKEDAAVKISLFDVTVVDEPTEVAKYIVDLSEDDSYQWSDSSALYEHKAFLFDREKELLVLPIGTWSKQSAYVFDISLDEGISLRGTVTHESEETQDQEGEEYYYYYDSSSSIQRSLYIEDVLYTISQNLVKANDLNTLEEHIEISLI